MLSFCAVSPRSVIVSENADAVNTLCGLAISGNGNSVNSPAIAHIIPAHSDPKYTTQSAPQNAPPPPNRRRIRAHNASTKALAASTRYPHQSAPVPTGLSTTYPLIHAKPRNNNPFPYRLVEASDSSTPPRKVCTSPPTPSDHRWLGLPPAEDGCRQLILPDPEPRRQELRMCDRVPVTAPGTPTRTRNRPGTRHGPGI